MAKPIVLKRKISSARIVLPLGFVSPFPRPLKKLWLQKFALKYSGRRSVGPLICLNEEVLEVDAVLFADQLAAHRSM